MTYRVVYQKAVAPSKGPQPGTQALKRWGLSEYPAARDLGIFNPRKIRGGRGWSLHAEGRAWDCGFPVLLEGHPQGHKLAKTLVDNYTVFGVQQVIWAHRIWTVGRTWRRYRGTSPHLDHVHVELCWDAALGLTETQIRDGLNPPETEESEMIADIYAAYMTGGRPPSPTELSVWVKEIRSKDYDVTETCLYIAHTVSKESR